MTIPQPGDVYENGFSVINVLRVYNGIVEYRHEHRPFTWRMNVVDFLQDFPVRRIVPTKRPIDATNEESVAKRPAISPSSSSAAMTSSDSAAASTPVPTPETHLPQPGDVYDCEVVINVLRVYNGRVEYRYEHGSQTFDRDVADFQHPELFQLRNAVHTKRPIDAGSEESVAKRPVISPSSATMTSSDSAAPAPTPETHPTVWIGADIHPEDIRKIQDMLELSGLPGIRSVDPHCTIMWSKNVPGIKHHTKYREPIIAKHVGWDVFTDGDTGGKPSETGGILVMRLKCEGLEARHREEMQNPGASWDHGDLKPHVSLKGWTRPEFLNTRVMPLLKGPIRFVGEQFEFNEA
jgi:hypothetical protein